jgi:hypothetical protein
VQVPLSESLLGWLCELNLALVCLSNREIAAYVQDQITPLNLSRLRTAKLVRQGIFQLTVSSLPLLKENMKSFANLHFTILLQWT